MIKEVVEKVVYVVGEFSFDTREEALAHIRYVESHSDLRDLFDASDIYWRDTSSDELAEFVIRNFEAIKSILELEEQVKA